MMNSRLVRGALASGVMFAALGASLPAQAIPAFARQTGMACYSCHFQSFPALNAFGRSFKAGGYNMVGAQSLVEGEHLSLPSTLNMAFVNKLRYTVDDNTVSSRGTIDFPDEAAFLVGGRVAENAGFLSEVSIVNGAAGMLGLKTQFNVTDNVALTVFGTDGQGAAYGFELLNDALQSAARPIENKNGFSAFGLVGLNTAAEGLAVTYHTESYYVNWAHYAPTYGGAEANLFGGLSNHLRGVYMTNIGDWDAAFGVVSESGVTKVTGASSLKVNATGVDVQLQGQLAGRDTGIYFTYAVAPKSSAGAAANIYNDSTTAKDKTAMGLLGKMTVIPRLNAFLAYSSVDGGVLSGADRAKATTRTTVGVQFEPAQNIELELFNEQASEPEKNSKTQLVMFYGY